MTPTICFACVCKNEEKCILTALKSVIDFIDYYIIVDTGSTDNTIQVITDFFKNTKIKGEIHTDEWKNFGHNKTLLFDRCYKKADYILHFDADDYFVGKPVFEPGKSQYYINVRKLNVIYPCLMLFDANYHWKFCGVAHTIIKCLDSPTPITTGYLTDRDFYMYSTPDTGARAVDPNKYLKDALLLKEQFFDTLLDDPDNLNHRSVFYTAQSFRDFGSINDAIKWYSLYTKFADTWIEERYYSYLQLGTLYSDFKKREQAYLKAIEIIPYRAEAYLLLGTMYNQNKLHSDAYSVLSKARALSFENVQKKYILFLNERSYSKFVNDELSVACYWTERYQDGLELLNAIIDDPDFEWAKKRLTQNKKFFMEKIPEQHTENIFKNIFKVNV